MISLRHKAHTRLQIKTVANQIVLNMVLPSLCFANSICDKSRFSFLRVGAFLFLLCFLSQFVEGQYDECSLVLFPLVVTMSSLTD